MSTIPMERNTHQSPNRMRYVAVWLAALLPAAVGVASLRSAPPAKPGGYDGPAWALLGADAESAAAKSITRANYPNCDFAVVDDREVCRYRADGTGEEQEESYVKVLTERGRRQKRVLTRRFMVPYSTVSVIKLELIREDGSTTPIDIASNSKETIDSSTMAMNIYDPNERVLSVNIPGLTVGDLIHSVTRETITRAIIPGAFSDENVFEDEGFIRHSTYEVIAPADKPLVHTVVRDGIPGTIRHTVTHGKDGTIVYDWVIDSVPRMYPEPAMPDAIVTLQRLFVSTLPDWQAVSKWYWNLSAAHLAATSPGLETKAHELVVGAKTPQDRMKAIFYYVSKNVRYMGITTEKDRPGFEPHDVCMTYDKKYGVCRDKAALLVAMLRAAGFRAYPVLESYGARKDPDSPDPDFNHAIVAVDEGGKYRLMDPTDENTLDFLPAEECNYSYLVCRPEGERLRTIPVSPPDRNMMTIQTTGSLGGSGTLAAVSEMSFKGVNDNAYREAFNEMKPDARRRLFEAFLKADMPGARLKSLVLTPANLLDRTQTLHARIEFTVDRLAAEGGGKAVVTLPWLGGHFGIVSFLVRSAGLARRKYPFDTYVACGVRENIRLKLAPSYTAAVSVPSCVPMNDPTKSYSEQVEVRDGVLTGTRDFEIKVAEMSPTEYLGLKNGLQTMAYDGRKAPILELSGPAEIQAPSETAASLPPIESDINYMDIDENVSVQDAHSATITFRTTEKVLTYDGKKRASEYKLSYNPAWSSARILKARVVSASGAAQAISPEEINVMDAGWNASAKRYTGGKILVANLPGVEIGSTLEVEAQLSVKGKAFLSAFNPFRIGDEVARKTFEISAPMNVPVVLNDPDPAGQLSRTETAGKGTRVFRWTASNLSAMASEGSPPPAWSFVAGVNYFAGNPSEYYRSVYDAMRLHADRAAKAGALARGLAEGHPGTLETLARVRDFVAKNIRAAGPGFTELPLSELSDADTTLSDGYGHAADSAILLDAMLTAAGFHPELLLASAYPPIRGIHEAATSMPLPHQFSYPLIRVVVAGQAYFLNDTDQYARLGTTEHSGDLAIVLPDGKYETVKAAPGCGNRVKESYRIQLEKDGTANIAITRRYYGTSYNGKKRFFSELPPEEKNRYFQQVVSSVSQGARPISPLLTEFDSYPGVERFAVQIDHYAVVDGKHLYFFLPFTPTLIQTQSDQRTLPLYLGSAGVHSITATVELPSEYVHPIILPKGLKLEEPDGAGAATVTTNRNGTTYTVAYDLRTKPAVVNTKDYPKLLSVESSLENRSARLFLVDSGPEDAAELNEVSKRN